MSPNTLNKIEKNRKNGEEEAKVSLIMMRKNEMAGIKKTLIPIRWCSHLILWRKFLDPIWGQREKTQKKTTQKSILQSHQQTN